MTKNLSLKSDQGISFPSPQRVKSTANSPFTVNDKIPLSILKSFILEGKSEDTNRHLITWLSLLSVSAFSVFEIGSGGTYRSFIERGKSGYEPVVRTSIAGLTENGGRRACGRIVCAISYNLSAVS